MPLLHKVWLLGILHAWISQHSIKCPHRDLQWLEGNISTQADLALHLSSPPFPLLTFLTLWGENLGVGGSRGRIYQEQAAGAVPAQRVPPARLRVPAVQLGDGDPGLNLMP